MGRKATKRKILGKYIVADPTICHGKPTFAGTRIMVWQVFEQLADGMSFRDIIKSWRGSVPKEAVIEALNLASRAFKVRKVVLREEEETLSA